MKVINVFVFSAVLAKFQSPRADIIFSDKVCFFTRDGVRHLCLRLGNLRCHTLYNPSLRLFVLKEKVSEASLARTRGNSSPDHLLPSSSPLKQETSEGESFIQIKELDVEEPGTVSGFYNITHKIDEESAVHLEMEGEQRRRTCSSPPARRRTRTLAPCSPSSEASCPACLAFQKPTVSW